MARLRGKQELEARDPDIAAMGEYWSDVDDILKGVKAMANERHLPRLPHETVDEYKLRASVVKMTNVFDDIVDGLVSRPFGEDVTFTTTDTDGEPPESVEAWSENIDGAGSNLTQYSERVFRSGVARSVAFIMVDSPKIAAEIRTRADEIAAGIRPYWTTIHPSNMCALRSTMINSVEVNTYARYVEPTVPQRVREFVRNSDGTIEYFVWVMRDAVAKPKEGEEYELEDHGKFGIDVIPIVVFATGERQGRTQEYRPALKKIVELQIDLFQDESGLKWIKRLAAYPMLAGNGITPPKDDEGKPKPMLTGPNRTLYSPPDGNGNSGSWQWIEPSTANMTFISNEIKNTIASMRELGNQPLTPTNDSQTRVQATQTASKSNAPIKRWVGALRDALENAAVIACKFAGITPEQYDPTVFVFDDFAITDRDDENDTLSADRENGDLSQVTLWEERKRRGVYGPDFTAERETARLLAESTGRDRELDDPPPPADKVPTEQE